MTRHVIRYGHRILDTADPNLSPGQPTEPANADALYTRCLGCDRTIRPTFDTDTARNSPRP